MLESDLIGKSPVTQAFSQGGKVVTHTSFFTTFFWPETLFFQRDLEGGQEGTEKGRKGLGHGDWALKCRPARKITYYYYGYIFF